MKTKKKLLLSIIFIAAMSLSIFMLCGCNDIKPSITATPSTISINDINLTSTVAIGGTAAGAITLDTATLPANITAAINDATIIITGTRPATDIAPITGEFTISATREGVSVSLTINVNLSTTWTNPVIICEECGKDPCECPTVEYITLQYEFSVIQSSNNWYVQWQIIDQLNITINSYKVYIDRNNGKGFVFAEQVYWSGINLSHLSLSTGKNTMRIESVGQIWLNNEKSDIVCVGQYDFDFTREETVDNYVFSLNESGFFDWNRIKNTTYSFFIDRNDGNGFSFVGILDSSTKTTLDWFKLSEGKNIVGAVASSSFQYSNGILHESRRIGYWDIECIFNDDVYCHYDFNLSADGSLSWQSQMSYNVYTGNYKDGFTFQFTTWSNKFSLIHNLPLGEGKHIIKIVSFNPIWQYNNGVATAYRDYCYFEFEIKEQSYTHDYVFTVNDSTFSWGAESNILYNIYLDRHDGNGFEFIRTAYWESWSSSNRTVLLSSLGLDEGKYTLKLTTADKTWRLVDGVISFGEKIGYWDFDTIKNTAVLSRNFALSYFNKEISWRDWNEERQENVYIDRNDGLGFVLVGTVSRSEISLNQLAPTLGKNKVMTTSTNPTASYNDGVITFSDIKIFWEFEYKEEDVEADYTFYASHDSFSFNKNFYADYYSIYVDRHDGNGFTFITDYQFVSLSSLKLTSGSNTVKVVSSKVWNYSDGILSLGSSIGYWDVELIEDDFYGQHNIYVSYNFFTITSNSSQMKVYVDRNDGLGFVYVTISNGYGYTLLEEFNFSNGKNTIRVISSDKMFDYKNGVLKWGYNMYDYHLEFVKEKDVVVEYDFKVTQLIGANTPSGLVMGGFYWHGPNIQYNIYVDRHDGKGFVFAKIHSGLSDATQQFSIYSLGLTKGLNTIKLVAGEAISFENDVLRFRFLSAFLTVDYKAQDYTIDYNFEIDDSDNLVWTYESGDYHVYIDRGDGKGFVFVCAGWGYTTPMSQLNPKIGVNTVKVVSINKMYTLQDGVLYYGINTGTFQFELAKVDEFTKDYEFEMWNNSFIWNGYSSGFSVYIDRGDGNDFVFVQTVQYSSWGITFANLKPLAGTNTIKVISQTDVWHYQNGMMLLGKSIGCFTFVYEEEDKTVNYRFNTNDNIISWYDGYYGQFSVYLDRHDGKGYVFVALSTSYNQIALDTLGLVEGKSYSLKVVAVNKFWEYADGFLGAYIKIGYWQFKWSKDTNNAAYSQPTNFEATQDISSPLLCWIWKSTCIIKTF